MTQFYESNQVVRVPPTSAAFEPTTAVAIAVDTAYVASQQGRNISKGVYMMDNMVANGSSGEGTMELSTKCPVGSLIGFNVVPINAEGSSGDEVVITGFTVSQGNVFTAAGQPRQHTSPAGEPAGAYWVGQVMNTGSQTYQIQIKLTVGKLQPVSYFVNWDPFITAQ